MEDCMFENRGQRVFPSDRLHILSLTWLSMEPTRLCADQQRWVSIYSPVDSADVKSLVMMTTEETGQVLYSNLDGPHAESGQFNPEIESALPESDDLSYKPMYNDAGTASDVNQFYVLSRVPREYICCLLYTSPSPRDPT